MRRLKAELWVTSMKTLRAEEEGATERKGSQRQEKFWSMGSSQSQELWEGVLKWN